MESPIQTVHARLRQSFGNFPATVLTEEDVLEWLTARVGEEIQYRPEHLMSLCYTLDLDESAVRNALDPSTPDPEPPFRRLARVLLGRQRARAMSKHEVRVPSLKHDPDAW